MLTQFFKSIIALFQLPFLILRFTNRLNIEKCKKIHGKIALMMTKCCEIKLVWKCLSQPDVFSILSSRTLLRLRNEEKKLHTTKTRLNLNMIFFPFYNLHGWIILERQICRTNTWLEIHPELIVISESIHDVILNSRLSNNNKKCC